MANGNVHGNVTIGASFGILSGFYSAYIFTDIYQPFMMFLGTVLGLIISNDLDVDRGFRGDYLVRQFHVEWLYDLFYNPYRRAIKHRSMISHFPIVGTSYRLIYAFLPISVLIVKDQPTSRLELFRLAVIPQMLSLLLWWGVLSVYMVGDIVLLWKICYPAVLGLMVSDILHWVYDFEFMKKLY